MANLNIEQKKVKSLFQESKYNFLIPDYQRPYAWGEMECKTLWDDLFSSGVERITPQATLNNIFSSFCIGK